MYLIIPCIKNPTVRDTKNSSHHTRQLILLTVLFDTGLACPGFLAFVGMLNHAYYDYHYAYIAYYYAYAAYYYAYYAHY